MNEMNKPIPKDAGFIHMTGGGIKPTHVFEGMRLVPNPDLWPDRIPPEEMAAQAERMTERVIANMEAGFSRMTAATISHPKPLPTVNELYDAMMAMKAECDRIARQIPDTQIIITGTIKGPPENLATTGGNVFITFPRRKPVDIAWLVPWLKGVKGYELPEGYTGARTLQIPARQTDGKWVMVDLLKPLDTTKLPDGWKPLCELEKLT